MSEPSVCFGCDCVRIDRARAEVVAADLLRRVRLRLAHVGVADDRQVFSVRLERLERRGRQVELSSGAGRRPKIQRVADVVAAGRAVHHLDRDEPRRIGRGARQMSRSRRARRQHRVEHTAAPPSRPGHARTCGAEVACRSGYASSSSPCFRASESVSASARVGRSPRARHAERVALHDAE